MQVHRVEVWISVFENQLYLNPDCQHKHRHQKRVVEPLIALEFHI